MRAALAAGLATVETPPKDAGFAIAGTSVSVVPAVNGVTVGLNRVASLIARGSHHVTANLETTPPVHTTEWAQKLHITELVASYTTEHPCCQPRVTNIHLAADTINNTIVEPGQTFSLNGALGPRTTDKGYKLAPGIGANLEFEDSVGGGVSQLSTTLFNAVFFGCYEDVTHTVHALYISRYPMGREATLNYPSIDNKFRNDSHSGVLIRTSYSGTSVTVALYGNKEGRTCRAEGPNVLQTIPIEPEYVDDPALPAGTQKKTRGRAHRLRRRELPHHRPSGPARGPPALRRALLDGEGQDRARNGRTDRPPRRRSRRRRHPRRPRRPRADRADRRPIGRPASGGFTKP